MTYKIHLMTMNNKAVGCGWQISQQSQRFGFPSDWPVEPNLVRELSPFWANSLIQWTVPWTPKRWRRRFLRSLYPSVNPSVGRSHPPFWGKTKSAAQRHAGPAAAPQTDQSPMTFLANVTWEKLSTIAVIKTTSQACFWQSSWSSWRKFLKSASLFIFML